MKQKIVSYLALLVKCAVMVPAMVIAHATVLVRSVYVLVAAALLGDSKTYNAALADGLDILGL